MAILKKYRDDYFRIVIFKSWAEINIEDVSESKNKDNSKSTKNTANNEQKLQENLSRAKSMIFQLALCNNWEYFVTLTLDKEKVKDRNDLNEFKSKLSKWFNNYNYKKGTHIKYVIIPEQHKNGSWHAHGFLMGVPTEHLTAFKTTDKLPTKMLSLLHQGRKIYDWDAYVKAFGYITIEQVINLEAVSKYVTKYITKEIMQTKIKLNEHIYYCSHGLNRAQELYRGELTKNIESDYENDYIAIKTVRTLQEATKYFTDD